MAKKTYRIPAALDRSFLDHEITLSGGGWSAPPLAIKVILFWAVSLLVLFWACTNTFIRSASPGIIVFIVIWWLLTTAFLGGYTKTKELKFNMVPALIEWLPMSGRRVFTRSMSDPKPFYNLVGIQEVSDDGVLSFVDGTFGRACLVVGSASILTFDEDQKAILNRVESFWNKTDPSTEWSTITRKEPQRVYRPIANLRRRHDALKVRDPELLDLMDEQYEALDQYVGREFKSIHQYMILKSDNVESLRGALSMLQSEVGDSSLMIKSATMLDRGETIEMLSSFYQGRNWGQVADRMLSQVTVTMPKGPSQEEIDEVAERVLEEQAREREEKELAATATG